jgi:DNA invertase Pin-like site-specific DNA recombinase
MGRVETMTRAIAYVRVSTDEQAEHGVSLEAQEHRIRAYCDLYGVTLVEVIVDAGESGKDLKRPGIQRALGRLRAKHADGLIVAKLDRMSRSTRDWSHLVENYFGEKGGFQLWSVNEQVDTRTATGRLILNILASVYQWERETIGERTKDALRHKRGCNEKTGGAIPYGFERGPDKVEMTSDGPVVTKTLVRCDAEQSVIDEVRQLRAQGRTLQEIATDLNARGIQRRGGKWDHTVLSRMLRKAA